MNWLTEILPAKVGIKNGETIGGRTMWTPCDEPIEEYNEETGKMETRFHCPYADTYTGYEDEMCRNCCGLGVDE